MKWSAVAVFLLAPWPVVAEPCILTDAGTVMTSASDTRFRVALRTEPAEIKVGSPFKVMLSVCSDAGAAVQQLTIDATMPAHRHGMNYKPDVSAAGEGRYEARGFLFHMPGAWQFAVTIHSNGAPSRLKLDVDIR